MGFPNIEEEDCLGFEENGISEDMLVTILQGMPACGNVDSDNISEWFVLSEVIRY
jgi:hypothetical protein